MSSRKVLLVTTITIALAIGALILFTGVVGHPWMRMTVAVNQGQP